MGYIRNGKYTSISSPTTRIEWEIAEEIKQVYKQRFGWRFTDYRFSLLSSQEQNDVVHQASVRVQNRRKGGG